jgi:hypothetical protein
MTRRLGLALGVSIVALLLLSAGAVAAAQSTSLQLTVAPAAKLEQGYLLTVRMRTADGRPVNEASVTFYELVDIFGARDMRIGDLTTDGQGQGTLPYLPAQLGSHQIVARFAGRDQAASAEARTTFEAQVAAAAYRAEAVPLSAFSNVVTAAVGLIVLSVWALIAFALISTARGVRRGARDLGPKGDLA